MVTLFRKMKKMLKNKKGSSLLLVLMTSSVIIVVGTSLLFISLSSFTRSVSDTNRQKAYEVATSVTDNIRTNMGSVLAAYRLPLTNNIKNAPGEEGAEKVENSEEIFVEFNKSDGTTATDIKINGATVSVSLKATACDKNLECSAILITVKSTLKKQTEIITFTANNALIDIDYLKESLGNSFVITEDFGTDANPITCSQINGDLSINVPEGEKRTLNANVVNGITGSVYANGDLIIGAANNIIKIQGNIYVKGNLYLRGVNVGVLLPAVFSNKCGTTEYYTADGTRKTATYNSSTGVVNGGTYTIGDAMYDIDGKPMQIYTENCKEVYYAKIAGSLVHRTGASRILGEAMYDENGEPKPANAVGGSIYVNGDIILDRTNINGLQSIIHGDVFCTGRVIIAPYDIGIKGGIMLDEPDDSKVLGTFSTTEDGTFNGAGLLNGFDASAAIGLPQDTDKRESVWHRYQYTYYDNPDNSYREKWNDKWGKTSGDFLGQFYGFINSYRNGAGQDNLKNAVENVYKAANNTITVTPDSTVKVYNKTAGIGELNIALPNGVDNKAIKFEGKMYILNDKNNDGIADDSFTIVNGHKVFNGLPTEVVIAKDVKKQFIDALTVNFNDNIVCTEIYVNGNVNIISSKMTNNVLNSNFGEVIYNANGEAIKNAFAEDVYINNYVDDWNVINWTKNEQASDNWKRWGNYLNDSRPMMASGYFTPKYYIRDCIRKSAGFWYYGYAPKDDVLADPYKIEERFSEHYDSKIIYIENSSYYADPSFNHGLNIFNEDGSVYVENNVYQRYDNYVALYTNKIHPYAVSTNLLHESAIKPLNYAKFTGSGATAEGVYKSAYEAFEIEKPYDGKVHSMYLRDTVRNFSNIDTDSTVEDVFAEMRRDDFVAIEIQRLEDITPETIPINIKKAVNYDWYRWGGAWGAYMWYNDEGGNTILSHSKIETDPLSDNGSQNYIYELREDYYFDFQDRDVIISSNWNFALTELMKTSRTTFRAYTGDDPNIGISLYLRAKTIQLEKVTFQVIGAGNLYIYLVGDTDLKAYAPGGAVGDGGDVTDSKLGTHFISDKVHGGTVMIIGAGNNNIEIGRGGYMNGVVYIPEGSYENVSVDLLGFENKGMSQGGEASVIANTVSIKGNNISLQYTAFDPESIGFGGARFQFEAGEDSSDIWVFGGYVTG